MTSAKFPYPIRTCFKCGKEFQQKRLDTSGKFCSRACSDATNKNPPAQQWIPKACAFCGNTFMCPPWQPEVTHCSNKCGKQDRAQTVRGTNHPLYTRVEMNCEVCGETRYVKRSLVKRFRACSKRCAAILSVQGQRDRISSIERKMQGAMHNAGLEPTPQYIIGPFITDFAFPEHRLVIECDGDYWHNLPKQQTKDRQKDNYLWRNGWHVLRFPEHRILSHVDECVQEIMAFLMRNTA